MLAQIGGDCGLLYCLTMLVFRWKTVVAKYGQLSLYWWVTAVTIAWWILGFLVSLALWGVEYASWRVFA